MYRPILFVLLSAALGACTEELKSPVTGSNFYGTGTTEPGGRVTNVASAPSFELDAPPLTTVGNLCTFRERKDPVIQGFSDRTGAGWEGEIRVRDVPSMDPKWFSPSDKRVATMVARPRVDQFRLRVDGNCFNPQTKSYYACSKILEADISAVRGFARAPTVERARGLAIQLCQQKVAEIVTQKIDVRQENIDLRCHVVEQAFCELPAPPPPPPSPKKK